MSEAKSMAEEVLDNSAGHAGQPEHVHTVTYDRVADVLTFDGFKFSGELMRQFTETPCGRMFRIVDRRDKVVTVSQEQHPLALAAPDMLAALKGSGSKNTPDFLDWLADRLVHQYGESPYIDFVLSLRKRASVARAAITKAEPSR